MLAWLVVVALGAARMKMDGLDSSVGIEDSHTCPAVIGVLAGCTDFGHVDHGFEEKQLRLVNSIGEYGILGGKGAACVLLPSILEPLHSRQSKDSGRGVSAQNMVSSMPCVLHFSPDEEYCPEVGLLYGLGWLA